MRAIAIDDFGGPDRLALRELDDPLVGPDYVLIENRGAGVNPVDAKIREGYLQGAFPHFLPLIPGWDAAGVVRAVGPAVTRFAPGDEVYAYCRKDHVRDGTYAELVGVREWAVAPKPRKLSLVQAAGVPLAGLTALQMLQAVDAGAGETVVVQAAAGGVGHFAVQLAKARGARVLGIAGTANQDFVRELGADHAIDYTEGDVTAQISELVPDGADVALDIFGGDFPADIAPALAAGGRVVSIASPPAQEALAGKSLSGHYVFVRPSADGLDELSGHADAGRLRVHVSEQLPLEQAARAHELIENGHVRGKVVLTIG